MKTASQDALRSLQVALPRDALVTDPISLIAYEVDGSLGLGAPQGIVLPRTNDEVASVVRWAAMHDVPIVARGAGTGLSGGALASEGGIILSFARMKDVLELDEVGRSVVIQPGIIQLTLDEFVKTKGLYYPPDPASGRACTLGGNFGENAGGPHCFKYGVTTNYVMGLKVVLADGRTVNVGGRAFDYPEYDLVGLIVGSEGTLGVITEASLRLMRNIPGIKTLMAIFDSVEEAGEAVSAVIARGLVPATLEMMDRNMIGVVEAYVHAGLPTDAEALLIIEADGYPASLEPQMAEFAEVLRERKARELRMAQNAAERDKIWFARKSAFGAIAQISPAYLMVDGTVPRSQLAQALAAINTVVSELDLRVGYVFHAGDGNLHPLIMFDPRDAAMVERMHVAGRKVMELCVQMNGTITGEHGVGSEKRQYMKLMFNDDELSAMHAIKEVFDPTGAMNPGKIFPDGLKASGVSRPLTDAKAPEASSLAPATTEEAARVISGWAAMETPPRLRVRGGGTKSGLLAPAELTLSTAGLTGIRAYAINDLYVTAGAGTRLADLQTELAKDKMWVPLASPWAESTLGGIVATNFNAPLRMRYGAIRDLLMAATVVMPQGRVIRAGKAVVKNVAGYDLPKLLTGSHGTLGLITDVTLKLLPFPRARTTLAIPIDTLEKGMTLGARLLRVALVSSSLLLCRGCNVAGSPAPYVMIYTAEGVPEDVTAELAEVRGALQATGIGEAMEMDLPSGSEIWGAWLNGAQPTDLTLRAGVAPKDLAQFVKTVAPVLETASFMIEFATGMLYLRSVSQLGTAVVDAVRTPARAAGGYAVLLSAPGVNAEIWGHAPDGLDLMQGIKAKWDPQGKFNPGAFIV